MIVTWDNFAKRRMVTIEDLILRNNFKKVDDIQSYLTSISVESPTVEEITAAFKKLQPEEKPKTNKKTTSKKVPAKKTTTRKRKPVTKKPPEEK